MKSKFVTILLAGFFLCVLSANAAGDILIEKGLAYLASVQSTSKGTDQLTGSSIDPHNVPVPDIKTAGNWGNAGITALCLQVFLANGHGVNDPLYGTNVTNAINYILASQQTTAGDHIGAIGSGNDRGYATAISIVALKSALKSGGLVDPLKTQVENALALATNYYTQDVNTAWTRVSWRYNRSYTSEINGDMSVNQWVILALDAVEYTGKDIWNKIYGYMDHKKAVSGDIAYMGYQDPNTWRRGNTAAGIWGLILAKSNGVAAADALSQKFYNFLEQYTLNELFNPASIDSHVYSGGGYYYYTYEVAKALSLGGKTNFAGGAWYNHLYGIINSQKYTDGNGNYYWDKWGGQGAPMETALALLALQTGTVPQGSNLVISLEDISKDENCIEFTINDGVGNAAFAGPGPIVYNNIPGSQWLQTTTSYMEWEKELQDAGNYGTLIKNVCILGSSPITVELCFKAYIEEVLMDEQCFTLVIQPQRSIGASAFVNAIGGLNIIITSPPEEIPIMELEPATINIPEFIFDHTYPFTFSVKEVGGVVPLVNVDLFASDLTDQFGNVIPAGSITLTPSSIALIPAGGFVEVQGLLTTPASFKGEPNFFQGNITAQTNQQAKGIAFSLGQLTPPQPVPLSNWAIFLSLFLIIGFIALYFRFR